MKFEKTLAQTVFSIALIVFAALVIFIFSNTAVARTPSVEVVEAGAVDIDVLWKTPSLEIDLLERTPAIDMGFYPFDSDPTRKSPIWNAFPEQPQSEFFEKTPSLEMTQPLDGETVYKNPSQAVREPLDIECCGPTMRFDLKKAAAAEIAIYSVSGRLVRRLNEALPRGKSSLTWDGRDDRGGRTASGVYFARVQASEETGKGKLVLVR